MDKVGPVTIDKISTASHIQYAENVAAYEPKYVRDASYIPKQTTIAVTTPSQSASDQLFGTGLKNGWANFEAPPGYFEQSNRFFSTQILPQVNISLILNVFLEEWEKLFPEFRTLKESVKKAIVKLLKVLQDLNTLLEEIMGRIRQFQKA